MKNWDFRVIFKEIGMALLLLFVISNLLSYMRKPELLTDKVPNIKAKLLGGNSVKIEDGKPLIIHFWATWCPTCKLEAPNIEYLSKKYNVITIAVQSGDDEEVKSYLKERKLTFEVINDENAVFTRNFNIRAYPTTLIYDKKGKLQFSEVGYTTTAGFLTRLSML